MTLFSKEIWTEGVDDAHLDLSRFEVHKQIILASLNFVVVIYEQAVHPVAGSSIGSLGSPYACLR